MRGASLLQYTRLVQILQTLPANGDLQPYRYAFGAPEQVLRDVANNTRNHCRACCRGERDQHTEFCQVTRECTDVLVEAFTVARAPGGRGERDFVAHLIERADSLSLQRSTASYDLPPPPPKPPVPVMQRQVYVLGGFMPVSTALTIMAMLVVALLVTLGGPALLSAVTP